MSTIVAVQKNGHVAIGADTMTKLGRSYEKAEYIQGHSKILQVGENYFATCGHASLGLILQSYFEDYELEEPLHSPRAIFEFARSLHVVLKDDYFLNPTEDSDDPFESSQISCLIANPHGIFGLYKLRSVQQYTKFYAFGSGEEYALGAMRAVYDFADYDAEAIARCGIEASAEFDDSTGLPLEIKTIKLNQNERELAPL